jgi:thiol-disulfide isomerase/thioredoxin
MDLSLPDRPLRRSALGACQGAVLAAVAYAIAARGGWLAVPSFHGALPLVLAGALLGAASKYLARGILGATAGVFLGALFGAILGDDMSRPTLARHHRNRPAKLSGITLEGKHYDIESRRGAVVLVDFWATWCRPCLVEMPRLLELYERYHDEGLDIVGVSLDESRPALEEFVRRKKIPWPQIYSETPGEQGWANPLLHRYTIRGIPYTLLVDREGKIVAAGLVGEDLELAVEQVMAGNKPTVTEATGLGEPITVWFGLFGALAGMLVERRLRQLNGQFPPRVAS